MNEEDVMQPSLGAGGGATRSRPASARFNKREPVRHAAVERNDGHEEAPRLQRNRKRSVDPLFIDKKIIPPHLSYEFKALSVIGKPIAGHMAHLTENHWTPVPEGRHPNLVLEHDGLVLMQRPKYLTEEAQREDYAIARDQALSAGDKARAAPDGTLTRDHPSVQRTNRINTSYEPLRIPEE